MTENRKERAKSLGESFRIIKETLENRRIEKIEEKNNQVITKSIKEERAKLGRFITLVAVGGSPGSGVTTFLKQVQILYSGSFDSDLRDSYKYIVHRDCVQYLHELIQAFEKENVEIHEDIKEDMDLLKLLPLEVPITPPIAQTISKFWSHPFVQNFYSQKKYSLHLSPFMNYFLERAEVITEEDYIPTDPDIIRVHSPATKTFVELNFVFRQLDFVLIDCPKCEPKKWLHFVETSQAMIFIADLNEYDLIKDNENVMSASIERFSNFVSDPVLQKTAMILFMNKSDLFQEKIAHVPISDYFPEFHGGSDKELGISFFLEKFMATKNEYREIYVHVTCLINIENVGFVMECVRDIVVRENLSNCDLF